MAVANFCVLISKLVLYNNFGNFFFKDYETIVFSGSFCGEDEIAKIRRKNTLQSLYGTKCASMCTNLGYL